MRLVKIWRRCRASAAQQPRHVDGDVRGQGQTQTLRLRSKHRDQVGETGIEIEIASGDRHPVRLDAGQVEDIVDQRQQRRARCLHDVHHLALIAVQPGVSQQIAHSDHGVQRRPELVTHGGEKLTLGLVGRLGLRLRLGQLANE